jgi:hypothetical protein
MWRRLRRIRRWGLPFLVVLSFAARPAPAQEGEREKPFQEPGISYREVQKPYIQWLVGAFLILAVLGVSFKNPHRTHLD